MQTEIGDIVIGDRRISVTVARSKRRRRSIAFVMETPSALKITVPMRASLSSIHSVIQEQTGWIKRRLAQFHKMNSAALQTPARTFEDGSCITYLGCHYKISVTHDNSLSQGCVLRPHRLIVHFDEDDDTNENVQEDVRLEILLWLKRRAKLKFQKRMDFWAGLLGVGYRKLVVANAERRWGSCNVQNVIRLNWRLIMAPLPILDYVVVHELCHVLHKNHGPQFWRQVESVIPDYKMRRKHLRFMGSSLTL